MNACHVQDDENQHMIDQGLAPIRSLSLSLCVCVCDDDDDDDDDDHYGDNDKNDDADDDLAGATSTWSRYTVLC